MPEESCEAAAQDAAPAPNYCDHCGTIGAQFWISNLQLDIDSANAGESAVLCRTCYLAYHQQLPAHASWQVHVDPD